MDNIEKAPILNKQQQSDAEADGVYYYFFPKNRPNGRYNSARVIAEFSVSDLIHKLRRVFLLKSQRDADHEHYSKQLEEFRGSLDIAYLQGVEDGKDQVAREILTVWEDYIYAPCLDFDMNHPEYAGDIDEKKIVEMLKSKYNL